MFISFFHIYLRDLSSFFPPVCAGELTLIGSSLLLLLQNDADSRSSAPSPQTCSEYETLQEHDSAYNNETGTVLDPSVDSNNLSKHSSLAVNAVKQPDWSKWKTTKAGHIDDKFADFRVLMPKEHSGSFQGLGSPAIPNANFNTAPVISNSMDSFGSFQTSAVDVQVSQASGLALPKNPLNVHMSTTALSKSTSMLAASETPSTREANLFQTHRGTTDAELSQDLNQAFSTPNTSIDSANAFGDFTSASDSVPEPQMSTVENKTPPSSAHFMSVPLQVSQRYALSGEDEVMFCIFVS